MAESRRPTTEQALRSWFDNDPTVILCDDCPLHSDLTILPRLLALQSAKEAAGLIEARSYGDVRQTQWAALLDDEDLIDYYADLYTEQNPAANLDALTEEELQELVRQPDSAPFDLGSHPAFADCQWHTTPAILTDSWMPVEMADRFGVPDDGYGWSYVPTERVYPQSRRDEIEQALKDLGLNVVHDHRLVNFCFGIETE